jgi:hypothetical protein
MVLPLGLREICTVVAIRGLKEATVQISLR